MGGYMKTAIVILATIVTAFLCGKSAGYNEGYSTGYSESVNQAQQEDSLKKATVQRDTTTYSQNIEQHPVNLLDDPNH